MELAEPIAIGVVNEWRGKCPFPHKKSEKVENDLTKDSKKLGTALDKGYSTRLWIVEGDEYKPKKQQVLKVKYPRTEIFTGRPPNKHQAKVEFLDDGDEYAPYSGAAHHLIPTYASFKKATRLMKYVKQGSIISGDIGYDVNGAQNGIWLPTSTAFGRMLKAKLITVQGKKAGTSFSRLSPDTKQLYKEAVMKKTSRQFHDAHPAYSQFVLGILRKLTLHMTNLQVKLDCKKCEEIKNNDKKVKPPYGLVDRLNSVGGRLRGKLTGGARGWRAPIFTSTSAKDYSDWLTGKKKRQ